MARSSSRTILRNLEGPSDEVPHEMLVWPMTEIQKRPPVTRQIDHESIELRIMVRSVVSSIFLYIN
jgi:hypothetical protein